MKKFNEFLAERAGKGLTIFDIDDTMFVSKARVIVKNKNTNQYTCNVYDENENILPITDIKENNLIIPIVELLGIKFSARSFQLDIIGKQMMVLNNKQLFNSCLIKRKQDACMA